MQLSATPFAAERSRLEDVTQSFLREQQFYLRRKRSDRSTEGETTGSSRAMDARPVTEINFSHNKKSSFFSIEKNDDFAFVPASLNFYK